MANSFKFNPGCGCGCAATPCGTLCVQVTGCSAPLTGATVTVSLGGTTVGMGTTSGQVNTAPVNNHGTGYTSAPAITIAGDGTGATAAVALRVNSMTLTGGGAGGTDGSYTDGTFAGPGGLGATFNYTVSGGVVTSATRVFAGDGFTGVATAVFGAGAGAGATASVVMALGNSVVTASGSGYTTATATVAGGGGAGATMGTVTIVVRACIGIPSTNTYTVVASYAGYPNGTTTHLATCGTTTSFTLNLTATVPVHPILFTVNNDNSCGVGAVAGATVTLLQSGVSVGTGTTNGAGQCSISAPNTGPFTATAAAARFVTGTVSLGTISVCTQATATITLSPASGYAYYQNCSIPTTTVLNFTDSVYGSCTVTYDPTGAGVFTEGCWVGGITGASYPGNGVCLPTTFNLTYYLSQCSNIVVVHHTKSTQAPGPCPGTGGSGTVIPQYSGETASHTCPLAFSATINNPSSAYTFPDVAYPSGVTFTATE